MKTKVSKFDVADYLDSEEMIAEYLNAVLEEEDTDLLITAIGNIAKAQGMSKIAETTGLGRESLYKALKPGAQPRFATIIKVIHSLGVDFSVTPKGAA